jgi:hypothetical protein
VRDGEGMGIAFSRIEPSDQAIRDQWPDEMRASKWLASVSWAGGFPGTDAWRDGLFLIEGLAGTRPLSFPAGSPKWP